MISMFAALWFSLFAPTIPDIGLTPSGQAPTITLVQGAIPRSHGRSTMEIVAYPNSELPGTIIISNADLTLHRILDSRRAERYSVSAGKSDAIWSGVTYVGMKREWPGWRPTASMRAKNPGLPEYVPPGPLNPLGARALYLFKDGGDTLYRIHGTPTADTVGSYETAGCFRLTNSDVMALFGAVDVGTKVIVH